MKKEHKTDSLSLCPFLQMNGLKYLRSELHVGKNDRPTVSFVFEDPKGIGRDLELEFVRSDFKKYKDLTYFFRNEIDKLKRRVDKINLEQERKNDDKYTSYELIKREG